MYIIIMTIGILRLPRSKKISCNYVRFSFELNGFSVFFIARI